MNKFTKKLLAKYVKYLEIIGYLFVLFFIAGLVALSNIKAEDEFVAINGNLEIQNYKLKFDQPHYIIELRSDVNETVTSNSTLMEVTNDEKFIADQKIISNLEPQVVEAQNAGRNDVANNLLSIIYNLEERKYPKLEISNIKSPISGEFILFENEKEFIPADKVIGGVFDFEDCIIRISEFPADKSIKKKIKTGQKGKSTIKLGGSESVTVNVSVDDFGEDGVILRADSLSFENKIKLAQQLAMMPDSATIQASNSILVGWKSWMRLIWR